MKKLIHCIRKLVKKQVNIHLRLYITPTNPEMHAIKSGTLKEKKTPNPTRLKFSINDLDTSGL